MNDIGSLWAQYENWCAENDKPVTEAGFRDWFYDGKDAE